jgi:hypothetical protein
MRAIFHQRRGSKSGEDNMEQTALVVEAKLRPANFHLSQRSTRLAAAPSVVQTQPPAVDDVFQHWCEGEQEQELAVLAGLQPTADEVSAFSTTACERPLMPASEMALTANASPDEPRGKEAAVADVATLREVQDVKVRPAMSLAPAAAWQNGSVNGGSVWARHSEVSTFEVSLCIVSAPFYRLCVGTCPVLWVFRHY